MTCNSCLWTWGLNSDGRDGLCHKCGREKAETRIRELETQLAHAIEQREKTRSERAHFLVRVKELEEDVYRIGCDRQKAEARIKELEEQAERCECDKHDWEKAEARIRELEARLEAEVLTRERTVKKLCALGILEPADWPLAQDVLRAAEGKP